MASVNSKYTNEILDDIQTYELVLQRKIKQFPVGFWTRPWSLESSAKITRYLIEKKLKWSIEDIPKKLSNKTFIENKLSGMLDIVYNNSSFKAINNAYPNKFKQWEFNRVGSSFWSKEENIISAVKWLVEDKLKLKTKEQVILGYNYKVLLENGLCQIANMGVYKSLNMTYPGVFNPKDFADGVNLYTKEVKYKTESINSKEYINLINDRLEKYKELLNSDGKSFANSFWATEYKYEVAKVITRYLIEEVLQIEIKDIPKKVTKKTFKDNKLHGMLQTLFDNSAIYAIKNAYPNRFKTWEFNRVPNGFWEDEENIKQAIRWLVEEVYKVNNVKQIKNTITKRTLLDNGLVTLTSYGITELLKIAYPEYYK